MGTSHDDRRRFERLRIRAEALYYPEPVGALVRGHAEDISSGGLRGRVADAVLKESGRRLSTGLELKLYLTLPGEPEPFFLEGVVAWTEYLSNADRSPGEWVFGVEFIDPPADLSRVILSIAREIRRESAESVRKPARPILQGVPLRPKDKPTD